MVPTGDGRDEALVLQTKQDGEVEFREGNGGSRQLRLRGILQVRADVSKVDENHGGVSNLGVISYRVGFEKAGRDGGGSGSYSVGE